MPELNLSITTSSQPSWQEKMAASLNQTPKLEICPSLVITHQGVNVTYEIYGRDASLVSFLRLY